MPFPKKYFQDKTVLLLLTLNLFLVFLAIAIIILRLTANSGAGYIVQFRSSLGIGEYKSGSLEDFLYFIIFVILVMAFHFTLSLKTYNLRRHFSVALLAMGTLLLVVAIIVSNALLVLR